MYEKILKDKIENGNFLILKHRIGKESESKYKEYVITVSTVHEKGISINNYDVFGFQENYLIPFTDVKPIVISEEYLKEIGIELDEDVNNDVFNEEWKLYKYGKIKFAYHHGALYEYIQVRDLAMGKTKIQVIGELMRYVHSVQNFLYKKMQYL